MMSIRSYRSRAARVQAMPFTTLTRYDALDWIRTNGGTATEGSSPEAGPVLILQTPLGNTTVCLGDWIIRDKAGVFSRCEPHDFVPQYDADDSAAPADRAEVFDQAADAIQQHVHCQTRAEANAKQNCVDLLRRLARAEPRTGLAAVLMEVQAERGRQDAQWGEQNHPDGTGGYTARKIAEDARRNCQAAAEQGAVTWLLIDDEEHCEALAESDPIKLRAGLVQSAAVKVAWIQAIDRRKADAPHPLSAGDGEQLLSHPAPSVTEAD